MKKFNMRATGILIQRKKILLIHRINAGKEYYVFPGGGIEEGESPAEGFLREMKEETNLDIHNYISLGAYKFDSDSRVHHVFLSENFSGDLAMTGPEISRISNKNQYILEWHPKESLELLRSYPVELYQKLLLELDHSTPKKHI